MGFLNLAMLAGLVGLALPVIAHLLSKRKFDVVSWGAMQFLELGRRTRRRIRLEELLLLLMRMGLIALLVLAVARPWARGGVFSALGGGPGRDVAIVIDGSYSMGWEGRAVTPHAAARQWLHRYLEQLQPGDTVALLDARDQVRPVLVPPTSDFDLVRSTLEKLPGPTGTSHLTAAIAQGAQLVAAGTNLKRDVIILSDIQALPWDLDDLAGWTRLDTLLSEAAVRPDLWLVNTAGPPDVERVNFSLDPLSLSREVTVPGFTVRIQSTVRQSGGTTTRRRVFFEVDGQRLDDKTLSVNLPANGQAAVQFEHQFPLQGSHVVSVVLEPDNLPGDNRSDAAILLREGIPVLLVDGDPSTNPVERETFYARSALTPEDVPSPWVRARVVDVNQFVPADLEGRTAVFLCNVTRLSPEQIQALRDFVAGGGGLVIAAGDKVDPVAWNALYAEGTGLLPLPFEQIASEEQTDGTAVTVASDSLQLPWMTPFRSDAADGGFDLPLVRFSKWWRLGGAMPPDAKQTPAEGAAPPPAAATASPSSDVPIVAARLSNGDPFIVEKSYERGRVIQLAAPLDDAWSTLPSRRALAPLLHEIVFHLAGGQSGRNVEAGEPLVLDLAADDDTSRYSFNGPGETTFPAAVSGDELHRQIRLADTSLPGLYRVVRSDDPQWKPQFFVVNSDRAESDLAPLNDEQRAALTADHHIRSVATVEDLAKLQAADAPRQELWVLLMCLVLVLLVGEVFLTRRLVQRGHESIADEAA